MNGVEHEHDARRRLAEQRGALVDPAVRRQRHLHPDAIADRELGQRDAEAALRAVVRRADDAARVRGEHELLQTRFEREIHLDGPAMDAVHRAVDGRVERDQRVSGEDHDVTGTPGGHGDVPGHVGEMPDRSDDREQHGESGRGGKEGCATEDERHPDQERKAQLDDQSPPPLKKLDELALPDRRRQHSGG